MRSGVYKKRQNHWQELKIYYEKSIPFHIDYIFMQAICSTQNRFVSSEHFIRKQRQSFSGGFVKS